MVLPFPPFPVRILLLALVLVHLQWLNFGEAFLRVIPVELNKHVLYVMLPCLVPASTVLSPKPAEA